MMSKWSQQGGWGPTSNGVGWVVLSVGKYTLGYSPFPVTVTTRIIPFLGTGIPINLHLPLLLGRGTTQNIPCVDADGLVFFVMKNLRRNACPLLILFLRLAISPLKINGWKMRFPGKPNFRGELFFFQGVYLCMFFLNILLPKWDQWSNYWQ